MSDEDPVMEAFGKLATALGHTDGRIEWPALEALFGLLETHRTEVLREAAERIRAEYRRQFWATRPPTHWAADLIDPEAMQS